jgi:hypothetical protein
MQVAIAMADKKKALKCMHLLENLLMDANCHSHNCKNV